LQKQQKKTFDHNIKFTPVIGEVSRKLPISPTTIILSLLGIGLLTGGLWPIFKVLVLGGVAFHTCFVNKKTKNNPILKGATLLGLVGAFLIF